MRWETGFGGRQVTSVVETMKLDTCTRRHDNTGMQPQPCCFTWPLLPLPGAFAQPTADGDTFLPGRRSFLFMFSERSPTTGLVYKRTIGIVSYYNTDFQCLSFSQINLFLLRKMSIFRV